MSNPIFKKLQNLFHDGVHVLTSSFTSSEQEALKVATASAHYVEQNGGQVLRDAASAAVVSAATMPGGGAAKLAAATASVITVLTTEGLPLVKSAINLAIEMALADARQAGLLPDSATPAVVA